MFLITDVTIQMQWLAIIDNFWATITRKGQNESDLETSGGISERYTERKRDGRYVPNFIEASRYRQGNRVLGCLYKSAEQAQALILQRLDLEGVSVSQYIGRIDTDRG